MSTPNFRPQLLIALLISLFFLDSFTSQGQTSFIDVFGQNEFATEILIRDSVKNEFKSYIFKSSNIFGGQTSSSTLHRVDFDQQLNLLKTAPVAIPDVSPYHHINFKPIPGWPGMVVAQRKNLSAPSPIFSNFYALNWDLCKMSDDSIYDCIKLLPDSLWGSGYSIMHTGADSMLFITNYSHGPYDSTFSVGKIMVDKQTMGIKRNDLKILNGAIRYEPIGNPLLLPNGTWFVQVTTYDTIIRGPKDQYAIIDHTWSNVISTIPVHSFTFDYYSKAWLLRDRVVFLTNEIENPFQWKGGDPAHEQITLVEYDLLADSITAKHYFDFSTDTSMRSNHNTGFDAHFDGEHFVIAATRSIDELRDSNPRALVVAAIDTSFNVVAQTIIEDSIGGPFLGAIAAIEAGPSKSFYYTGFVFGSRINPNSTTADLLLGKLDLSNIGTEEFIKVRHQQTWLYPNPTNGKFKLTNTAVPFKPYQYKVFDVTGKLILTGIADSEKQVVHVNLAHGTYYLSTEHGDVLPFVVE